MYIINKGQGANRLERTVDADKYGANDDFVNKGQGANRLERTVDADKYGANDDFVNFTKDGARVFSIHKQYVMTIERAD